MNINWPEVLVGGSIFFVLGAVFTIFFQPQIEGRLRRRREETLRRREAADAAFRRRVAILANNPNLFAAESRAIEARIVKNVVAALTFIVLSMLVDSVAYPFGALLVALALWQLIPIAKSVKVLSDTAQAVADLLDPE